MAHHRILPEWHIPERQATPESIFFNRRTLLKGLGLGALTPALLAAPGAVPALWAQSAAAPTSVEDTLKGLRSLEAKRNPAYTVERPPTREALPAQFNNFYEFSMDKDDVWKLAQRFQPHPWKVEVGGMVAKPRTFDLDDLIRRMPLEERVYRFRCVEAWSMVVPWVGFPLSALLKEVQPLGSAKFVRFTTFNRPKEAPRQMKSGWLGATEPWPYTEGLTLAEAGNELTLLTVGSYGHILPKQHGAPIRLIAPWKYGFKNIKSIEKIELTDKQPETFWNTLAPSEYGFESNVDPKVPHPRWSQAHERDIGTREQLATLYLNGYEKQVGGLYTRG